MITVMWKHVCENNKNHAQSKADLPCFVFLILVTVGQQSFEQQESHTYLRLTFLRKYFTAKICYLFSLKTRCWLVLNTPLNNKVNLIPTGREDRFVRRKQNRLLLGGTLWFWGCHLVQLMGWKTLWYLHQWFYPL